MARVPYVDVEALEGGSRRLFATLERLTGRVSNSWRIVGHSPHLLTYMVGLSLAVNRHQGWVLPRRLKRLAILRSSLLNECSYCVSHNTRRASEQGITEDQVAALGQTPIPPGQFDDRELAVLAWTDAVTHNTARRDGPAFAELERHLSHREIVELTIAVAHRSMINRIQEALWTDLEPDPPAARPAGVEAQAAVPAEQWMRDVLDTDTTVPEHVQATGSAAP